MPLPGDPPIAPTYLILPTEEEAKTRSNEAWAADTIEKNVTKYLWPVQVGKDGRAAIVIDSGTEKFLDQAEVAAKVPQLDPVNWPAPPPIIADSTAVIESK